MKTYIEIFKEVDDFTNQFLEESLPRLPILEYNTDTSAGHPVKDDDIVRYSEETQRVKNKES